MEESINNKNKYFSIYQNLEIWFGKISQQVSQEVQENLLKSTVINLKDHMRVNLITTRSQRVDNQNPLQKKGNNTSYFELIQVKVEIHCATKVDENVESQ